MVGFKCSGMMNKLAARIDFLGSIRGQESEQSVTEKQRIADHLRYEKKEWVPQNDSGHDVPKVNAQDRPSTGDGKTSAPQVTSSEARASSAPGTEPHHDQQAPSRANSAKPRIRGGFQAKRYYAKDQDTDEYHESESDPEADQGLDPDGDTDMDGVAAEAKPSVLDNLYSTLEWSYAERRSRETPRKRVQTPDSYPDTSDGQTTKQSQSPPRIHHMRSPTHRQGQHLSHRTTCEADEQGNEALVSPYSRDRQQRNGADDEPPQPQVDHEHQVNGVDEHGAKHMFDRAREYHKAHARSNSQTLEPVSRKPAPGTPLPSHTRSPTAEHAHFGPNMDKAFNTLGLPSNQSPQHLHNQPPRGIPPKRGANTTAGAGTELQSPPAPPMRDHCASITPPAAHPLSGSLPAEGTVFDYDPPGLYQWKFSALMAESFDTDPRRPRESDEDPPDVSSRVASLKGSLDPSSAMSCGEAEAFFASLTLAEWVEAGKSLTEEFRKEREKLSKVREGRRTVAQRFESEVAKREGAVQDEIKKVEGELGEMRKTGGQVLLNRTPSAPQKRQR